MKAYHIYVGLALNCMNYDMSKSKIIVLIIYLLQNLMTNCESQSRKTSAKL